jgi:hypothetical protein
MNDSKLNGRLRVLFFPRQIAMAEKVEGPVSSTANCNGRKG